jgi:sugar-phosphatase
LRIDLVVDLWFAQQPWKGPDRAKSPRALSAAPLSWWKPRPLLPGVREAVALCKAQGLKVGLASASPLRMLEKVLTMFELRDQFDALASAESLPYSKPHPQVYLNCAASLGVDPMRCVALEDSVNGMIASKAARMRSIVVPEEENSRDPRFVLADVKLRRWNPSPPATLRRFPASDRRQRFIITKIKHRFIFNCFSFLPSMLVSTALLNA